MRKIFICLIALVIAAPCWGERISTTIPMFEKSARTFYIVGRIANLDPNEFMVDTGSSYTTINEQTLAKLLLTNSADHVRDLTGVLANGDELPVPVYRITRLEIGQDCHLDDIEVAVFPGSTRQILGLNTLRQKSPFLFSVEPPELHLSNCL